MKKLLKVLMPAALALVAFALMPAVNVKAMEATKASVDAVSVSITEPEVGQTANDAAATCADERVYLAPHDAGEFGIEGGNPDDGYKDWNGTGHVLGWSDESGAHFAGTFEEGKTYTYIFRLNGQWVYDEETQEATTYDIANDTVVNVNGAPATVVEVYHYVEDGEYPVEAYYGYYSLTYSFKEDTPAEEEKKEDTPAEEEKKEETPAKEEEAKPAELKILDGADQEVDGTGDVTIRANGEFDNFSKLLMDGAEVSEEFYTKKAGSTIVTLKASYVASLGAGAHTVSFVYKDGSTVKTTLTLKAAANSEAAPAATNTSTPAANPAPAAAATDSVAPKTGENIVWLYVILAMSALGMGVTAVSIKKNK